MLGAEGFADLPQVRARQYGREQLKKPQQHAAGGAGRPGSAGEGPLQRDRQVNDDQEGA